VPVVVVVPVPAPAAVARGWRRRRARARRERLLARLVVQPLRQQDHVGADEVLGGEHDVARLIAAQERAQQVEGVA
jgi:hypothetical protein